VWGMNDEANPEADERFADLQRRRADAADVPAESLLDIWLRDQRRAKRARRPWPPNACVPPLPKSPKRSTEGHEAEARTHEPTVDDPHIGSWSVCSAGSSSNRTRGWPRPGAPRGNLDFTKSAWFT